MKISQQTLGDSPPFKDTCVLRALLCCLSLALWSGLALRCLFDNLLFCRFLFYCHGNQLLSIFTVGFYAPLGARIRVLSDHVNDSIFSITQKYILCVNYFFVDNRNADIVTPETVIGSFSNFIFLFFIFL